MTTACELDFGRDGALHFSGVLSATEAAALAARMEPQITGRPGTRLKVEPGVGAILAADGAVGRIAAGLIGSAAMPVRTLLFDKSPDTNWIVGWHQDRTISVRERHETPGFGPWSTKDGALHVAPPIEVLEGMVTLRLHLDPVDAENAPLIVAMGSHRLGYVAANLAAERAGEGATLICEAEPGDVWAYSTPILHMSARSSGDRRRRVLQIDYAAVPLPDPLEWRGVEA
ncbi:phytanoyl-CoA dioxygenase family protein [Brevundimonas sp.]|uniref:phytanoyl-CoA dioxygenase family protein n=1 Tax=Brevundimonas sp. TaxID=1871086 RepID=UPI003D151EDC